MLKKIVIAAYLTVNAIFAWATCTTSTTYYQGKTIMCTTCCYSSGNCTTNCY